MQVLHTFSTVALRLSVFAYMLTCHVILICVVTSRSVSGAAGRVCSCEEVLDDVSELSRFLNVEQDL
jgi:hypothetical protein